VSYHIGDILTFGKTMPRSNPSSHTTSPSGKDPRHFCSTLSFSLRTATFTKEISYYGKLNILTNFEYFQSSYNHFLTASLENISKDRK
jgi:hypothetical protein